MDTYKRLLYLCIIGIICLILISLYYVEHFSTQLISSSFEVGEWMEEKKRHCVYYNFLRPDVFEFTLNKEYTPISLALHSTINYSPFMVEQANTWNDLISYALIVNNEDDVTLLKRFSRLWHCEPNLAMRVSVHLVWPKSPFQSGCQFDIMVKEWRKLNSSINCSADGGKEADKRELRRSDPFIGVYPINVMRNVARKGAPTNLHLVADIENYFSENFAKIVRNFTKILVNAGDKNRHVLVFRRFEVEDGVKFPRNITQLAQLYENNKAVEFHSRFFFEGHHIPGLDKWFNYSLRERAQVKTWELRYNRSTWEPQLIMRDDAPYHFEQIPTRVQDHQVLANELCRASHKFYLLSHVFNAHRGIKQSFTPVEKVVSEAGKVNARAIIPTFNAYLDSKYPDTKGKCPTINV